ncbi:MAG: hypothetical protein Q9208_008493 [Pyrenodesmia sp. 3 TL-2023]
MTDTHPPPLNWEASASATNPTVSTTLPPEVETCLQNARFVRPSGSHPIFLDRCLSTNTFIQQLHLATCSSLHPHVSLMNYTYLPSTPFPSSTRPSGPIIIMTTNPSSRKTLNLLSNPNVSLLVHDWVSHRPPTVSPSVPGRSNSPPAGGQQRSSLASLLLNINTSALSSISATIEGTARMLERGSEEERWCKERHLENHTFGEQGREEGVVRGEEGGRRDGRGEEQEGDGGASCFIEGEEVRVVVVGVREGRIADWKGGVKDWVIVSEEERERGQRMVNGVV